MKIDSIRLVDSVKNYYVVVIDGVEMTLSCFGDPTEAIKVLFRQ